MLQPEDSHHLEGKHDGPAIRVGADPERLSDAFKHFRANCVELRVPRDQLLTKLQNLLDEDRVITSVALWTGLVFSEQPEGRALLGRCIQSGNFTAQYIGAYFLGMQGEGARSELPALYDGLKTSNAEDPPSHRNIIRWAIHQASPPAVFEFLSVSVNPSGTTLTSDPATVDELLNGGCPDAADVADALAGVVLSVVTDSSGMFVGPYHDSLVIKEAPWKEGVRLLKRSLLPVGAVAEQADVLVAALHSNIPQTRICAAYGLASLGETLAHLKTGAAGEQSQSVLGYVKEALLAANKKKDVIYEAALLDCLVSVGFYVAYDEELVACAHNAHTEAGRAKAAEMIGRMGEAGARYLPLLYQDLSQHQQHLLCGTAVEQLPLVLGEQPALADEAAQAVIDSRILEHPSVMVRVRAFDTFERIFDFNKPVPETVVGASLSALRTDSIQLQYQAGEVLSFAVEYAPQILPELERVIEQSQNDRLTAHAIVQLACLLADSGLCDFSEVEAVRPWLLHPDPPEVIGTALAEAFQILEGDGEPE